MKLKTLLACLCAGFTITNADDGFSLKGNLQTQVTKSLEDEDNNVSSVWIRANVGGQYKSENLDGTIMLRLFAPEFGNNIDGKNYDKILADLYWVNYKWKLGDLDMLNLKLGRWKTDWSQSGNLGTYIDKPLTSRGMMARDYSHNALEFGWKHGFNQLNAMLAIRDGKANSGYVRIEDAMKFTFPLEFKVAYRSNAIDVMQNTALLTHRIAAYASYKIVSDLRLYGEFGCLYTQDDEISPEVHNYLAPESKYFKAGESYLPFYLGLELPMALIHKEMPRLMVEVEYIKDRDELEAGADELGWTVGLVKSIGKTKLQFNVYSEKEVSDVALALRVTSTIK